MKEVKMTQTVCRVPEVNVNYIPWGEVNKIEKIIKSNSFYPVWLTGSTGTGKTVAIEQACAKLGRKFVRINFTNETSEEDLIGGFRLEDGETVFEEGAVVRALREGAILLLDEVDVGHTNKILVLQSVMEGKGVFIKATNEWVKPSAGFNVFATSNTQGHGSDDGRYIGTNIQNAAFLDRFAAMIHFVYPPKDVEEKMLTKYFSTFCQENIELGKELLSMGENDKENFQKFTSDFATWVKVLVEWANETRTRFDNSEISSLISTRSLINIVQSFSIFLDKDLAVQLACARFEQSDADAIEKFYQAMMTPESDEPQEEVGKEGEWQKWTPQS